MQAREYNSAGDMLKHYAALRAKFRPAPRPVVIPRPFIAMPPSKVPLPLQHLSRDMGEVHTVTRPKWIIEALKTHHDCKIMGKIPFQLLPDIMHPSPDCNRPIRAEIERIMAEDQVHWGMIRTPTNSSYLAKTRRKIVLVMCGFGMSTRYIAGRVFGRDDHSGIFRLVKNYPIPVGVPDGGVAGVYPVLIDPTVKPRGGSKRKPVPPGAPSWISQRGRMKFDPLSVKPEEMCPMIKGNPELWAELKKITETAEVHWGLIRSISGHPAVQTARRECIAVMRRYMTVQEICAAVNRTPRSVRESLAPPEMRWRKIERDRKRKRKTCKKRGTGK